MKLQGKKVLVFGTGISGIGAADLLKKVGATVILYDGNEKLNTCQILDKLSDKEGVSVILGELEKEILSSLDLVV